jgi:steroid 5-alpha reductase family enzyme
MPAAALILTAAASGMAMSAIMAAAWLIERRTGNSGWIDVSWSLGVGGAGAIAALWPIGGGSPDWRAAAVAILVLGWGLRLGAHIAVRTREIREDPRYRDMIERWGGSAARRLFWFLQAQAAVGAVLVAAAALAAHGGDAPPGLPDVAGLVVMAAALAGEAIADRQLRLFKGVAGNAGRICQDGLWGWSRHPNYFFEWLFWVGVAVVAAGAGGPDGSGWFALAAPACMYWVLVHASGIPPLEAHMRRSRGDDYRAYQERVPAFFPVPPSWRSERMSPGHIPPGSGGGPGAGGSAGSRQALHGGEGDIGDHRSKQGSPHDVDDREGQ